MSQEISYFYVDTKIHDFLSNSSLSFPSVWLRQWTSHPSVPQNQSTNCVLRSAKLKGSAFTSEGTISFPHRQRWGWKRSLWYKDGIWNIKTEKKKRLKATHCKMWKNWIHTTKTQSHKGSQAILKDFVTAKHFFVSSWRKTLSERKTYWRTG